MNLAPDELDGVWQALANPWRRRILDELRDGPLSTGQLTDRLGAGRHLVLQHLKVLRDATLVITESQGRRRINHLNSVPIQMIYERWVAAYEGTWSAALVGLKRSVERPGHQAHEENAVG